MIITGTIEKILPIESGKSRAGKEWRKGAFLMDITVDPSWPKKLMVTMFGKALDNINIIEGQKYDIDCDVSSREWTNPNTGKTSWFTEVSAFHAILAESNEAQQALSSNEPSFAGTAYQQAEQLFPDTSKQSDNSLFNNNSVAIEDDLPF